MTNQSGHSAGSAPATSVLVANRGEIARRVFATCRAEGIDTVAVFSDADANSPHVREADVAVNLPGNSPGETYLRGELVIAAAVQAGADAVHPGYGFLSENAEFAQQVQNAGLTWIGPPVKAIELMGSKVESKAMMADAGVPVLTRLDPSQITEDELPVLVKASAGGGGRGMRIVRDLKDLQREIETAGREALSAFGDGTVFVERYIETGRHIEVQVMADRHGTVWTVGERECSIQRRHQKVVEEAPSPLVERIDGMRERLFDAARLATEAIGYEGAGTVEFLADEKGNFFFLEMNTRLQVEHPVTECTTGLDLVALQISVASGEPLPAHQPATRGHSIEVRLYAEDPSQDWQPQSGPVHTFDIPGERFSVLNKSGIRVDSGVETGSHVGTFYDPMLAKVISFAPTREQAANLLAKSLQKATIHGLVTNRDLLVNVLQHPAFLAGDTDTAFFDTHGLDVLAQPIAQGRAVRLSALAAALADAAHNRASARVNKGLPSGWRNLPSQPQRKQYGDEIVEYTLGRYGLKTDLDGVALIENTPNRVVLDDNKLRRTFHVARYGPDVFIDSSLGPVRLAKAPRFVDPTEEVAAGSLLAPMPGSVVRVAAAQGDTVTAGQPILWLEAMKMEHTVTAPADGVLTELNVSEGQQVEVGAVLAVVQAGAEPAE
ncbi:acetyl/propionyl-CoA carboxylase subunit alpha [Rhodococcus sp. 06-156-3C]|uniref:acetyl/propionyl/methylcrotonyl-CoA carboxylase subunit alpha n=1 Tax=Nocardiaceae TaxID=85025 RepID=UPI000522E4C0|nr:MULTISPECIES: biotin carboxylase N-terminal domain-containing protein [Rhodococcus]OZD14153.1 acetyl/propionyl-CoA carboxylase subunit alpha [Rhodococcus sp. 06-156-3C]OZD15843.1 acetyl/propionyl-CoA carboxylase subunit alpha [Rhodococcus sp. 06-156-4C]OZD24488.1 acetyl/propionyl-CoA carboxylase subunit alpha [Rhodococcus sp. 06-156-3b]OZD28442.1 acetyl/propionyl-CoA carboxylase subunit alpha [Rhodococcus sp. 06-156-4a]OZD36768.1 acetyl/propionyl-CoA carboxylase subunit alpha [Rhodococcus s